MTQEEFSLLLVKATRQCLDGTREYVTDVIPNDAIYRVIPNQSYDGNPLEGDEKVFPQDTLLESVKYLSMNSDQVTAYLWRDEKVPEWINLEVAGVSGSDAVVQMTCCGRYTADEDKLYYQNRGLGPFGVKIPIPASLVMSGKLEKYSLSEARGPLDD